MKTIKLLQKNIGQYHRTEMGCFRNQNMLKKMKQKQASSSRTSPPLSLAAVEKAEGIV
jgi:hypothetical protein